MYSNWRESSHLNKYICCYHCQFTLAIFSWTKSKKSRAFLEFRPYSAFNFGSRNRRPKAENFPFWPKGRNSGILLLFWVLAIFWANTSPDILFVNQVITYCLFDLPVKLEQVHPYCTSGLFGNCVQIFLPKSNVNTSFPKHKDAK